MQSTLGAVGVAAKKAPAGNRAEASRANGVPGCALTAALAAIGGRWKLFIVYRLSGGPLHFAALRRSLPQMSAKVLTQQVREMQVDGLVSRTSSGPVPAPVFYALTAHGLSVLPVAESVRRWGTAHQAMRSGSGRADRSTDAGASCEADRATRSP